MSNTVVAEDTRREARTAVWVAAVACTALSFDGYGKTYSLTFLLVLNSGAVFGGMLASKLADRSGPQRILATTIVLAAITLALMTFAFPLPVLFIVIAIAGVGTLGTQVLIYGSTSNYYTTNARAADVASGSGCGRLGGILGPLIGGWLLAVNLGGATAFYIFGAVALFGALVTILVPRQRTVEQAKAKAEEILETQDIPAFATDIPVTDRV